MAVPFKRIIPTVQTHWKGRRRAIKGPAVCYSLERMRASLQIKRHTSNSPSQLSHFALYVASLVRVPRKVYALAGHWREAFGNRISWDLQANDRSTKQEKKIPSQLMSKEVHGFLFGQGLSSFELRKSPKVRAGSQPSGSCGC